MTSKRELINRIGNIALLFALGYAGVVLGQRWLLQDKRIGVTAPSFDVIDVNNVIHRLPPNDGKPSILVFWATWCGPCKMEFSRLKRAVAAGEIPADRVFAVSLGETTEDIAHFNVEHHMPFPLFVDQESTSGELYSVRATPTVVHVASDLSIAWIAEGLHPLSINKAATHLSRGK